MINNRQSIRLKNYDYSKSGLYFITICTQNRECLFGDVVNHPVGVGRDRPVPDGPPDSMILNQYGIIVENVWESLPDHHPVELDALLGFIVGMFKTECTAQINRLQNTPGQKIFQRNYYEHIIRNEIELNKIRQYIKNNPLFWNQDINH